MKKIFLAGIALGVLAAPAVAADMYVKARPPAPAPYLWNGFYLGFNSGYADEQTTVTSSASPTSDAALGLVPGVSEGLAALSSGSIPTGNGAGFIGGGQIGYNLQLSSLWLVGIEADFQGKSGTSSGVLGNGAVVVGVPVGSGLAVSTSTDWLGTVRGRLGLLLTPAWLVYATGGLAYGHTSVDSALFQIGSNGFNGVGGGSASDTRVGWTVGGGLEWMFAQHWSAKAEYLFYNLGSTSIAYPGLSVGTFAFATPVYQNVVNNVHVQGNIARAGINYHF